MSLVPHAKDPNRRAQLKDINDMLEGDSEAKGLAKQKWNADSKGEVKEPDLTPEEKAAAEKPEPKKGKK